MQRSIVTVVVTFKARKNNLTFKMFTILKFKSSGKIIGLDSKLYNHFIIRSEWGCNIHSFITLVNINSIHNHFEFVRKLPFLEW